MAYINSEPPRSSWVKTALVILLPAFVLGLTIYVLTQDHSNAGLSYYKSLMTVEEHEYASPAEFLKSEGTYRPTLFGSKYKLEGYITNTASKAVYKDAVIEISFYSRTKTRIGTSAITIYDVFPPGDVKNFNIKVKAPKATDRIGWEVIDAARNQH